jgi:hypothetical protein
VNRPKPMKIEMKYKLSEVWKLATLSVEVSTLLG